MSRVQTGMRLDHGGVNVADLQAAAAWYSAAFDLTRELDLRVDAIDLDIVM
jgi:catechol 2,3-dioxygenase-like lactoylglutathione lyase family enzyme